MCNMKEQRKGCENTVYRVLDGMQGNFSLMTLIFSTKEEVESFAGNEGGSDDIWVLKNRIEEV